MIGQVRLFHTKAAIVIGVMRHRRPLEDSIVGSRMGTIVENPVVVIVGGESVSLMPMYTLTVERSYFIPDDTMLYGASMTPSEGLADAYAKKYAPVAPVEGFGLTTYPKDSQTTSA
jgi:hypothetical protein